jgi:hypothetical protein
MYPALFERNVNNITVSVVDTTPRLPGHRARFVGPRAGWIARCSEARVRCGFMAKPPARENCHPRLAKQSPAHGVRKTHRWWAVACTFAVVAVNAAAVDSNGNQIGARHRSFGSRRW